jgi:hypothetical protein
MKKAVLREYLKNREKDVTTINQDSFFTIEVEEPTEDREDVAMELVKKAAKKAADKVFKSKKGDK